MKSRIFALAGLCAAALMSAGTAQAALLDISITGGYTASFHIDSKPAPNFAANDNWFGLFNVAMPGSTTGKVTVVFWHNSITGGITIYDHPSCWLCGGPRLYSGITTDFQQLYTGIETAPTIKLGSYDMDVDGSPGQRATVTVSLAPPVPEPAGWALMIGGFALAGGAMRRQKAAPVAYRIA